MWWSAADLARKEVTLMTEQALYYSYFKTTVDPTRSLPAIFNGLINDDTVEHPTVLNALRRFNVWPEVVLGMIYRWLPIGQPIDFYVNCVFAVNGLLAGGLFYTGALMTHSWLGGLVAFLVLPANFYDSTRAWGSVSLRESISIPFMFAQLAALTQLLQMQEGNSKGGEVKDTKTTFRVFVVLTIMTLISWQLAASVMALQTAALFATHLCGYLSSPNLRTALIGHFISIVFVAVATFFNRMAVNSPYTCAVVGSYTATLLLDRFFGEAEKPFPGRLLRSFCTGLLGVVFGGLIKLGLSLLTGTGDDNHMYHLLLAKYGKFRDFHTSLYLHMDSFLAMPMSAVMEFVRSGTLPFALLAAVVVLLRVLWGLVGGRRDMSAVSVFHLFMGLGFTGTAMIFYRLRFMWTPDLGLLCALAASSDVTAWVLEPWAVHVMPKIGPGVRRNILLLVMAGVLTVASGNFEQLRNRLAVEEQFDLPEMRNLVDWLRVNTPKDAVISGDMSTMASVKLMAERKVANHPHYEDESIRRKTYKIAHWFGRRTIPDVHRILSGLNITYIVNHHPPCQQLLGRSGKRYADFLEKTDIQCCLAVGDLQKRKGYFELVRDTKEWPVYKVLPRSTKPKKKTEDAPAQ
eukprot:comp21088_c0_seq2/m.28445 comp21088_c0_seq2/g.28445  ORF comp21088_c0_seq2/g.28445 comp21088_c0_seq2/m.28445 type:complete len:630 (-) comp21088_c0_seq2:47-1936(-)